MTAQIGAPVRRREDFRFITGQGMYVDDINRPGQAYAVFVRSPHAHAKIRKIDTAAAKAAPGVVAVFTGKDTSGDKVGGLICGWVVKGKDGQPHKAPAHPVLAVDAVRYVGDHVAVVIADSLGQARDAAELVDVDYEVLTPVVDPVAALKGGAPQLHGEAAPGNLCYDWELGDKAAVDAAFKNAAHVAKLDLHNNRLVPNPMEPRSAIGEYDRASDSLTCYSTSQNPH